MLRTTMVEYTTLSGRHAIWSDAVYRSVHLTMSHRVLCAIIKKSLFSLHGYGLDITRQIAAYRKCASDYKVTTTSHLAYKREIIRKIFPCLLDGGVANEW